MCCPVLKCVGPSRMSEVVASVLQYKTKIDQLKQESASMKTTYEVGVMAHTDIYTNICIYGMLT